jgi:hypothetical protein
MKINKSLALILLALTAHVITGTGFQAMKHAAIKRACSSGDITEEDKAAWGLLLVRNLARAFIQPMRRATLDQLGEQERNAVFDTIALNQEARERARLIREGEDVRGMSRRDVLERAYIRANEGRIHDEREIKAADRKDTMERKAARERKEEERLT